MEYINLAPAEIQAESTEALYYRWTQFIEGTEATRSTYTRSVKLFLEYLQDNGITQPTRDTIREYRDFIKADHKPSTTQTYLAGIKNFFSWTEAEHLYPNVSRNVKTGVKQAQGFKKDYLTSTQVKTILESIDRSTPTGRRDYAILLLMVTSGLRTIEIIRTSVEDLRPVADYTALFIQGKGCSGADNYVKIPQAVEQAIRESLQDRPITTGKEPLFCSWSHKNYGQRLTTRSISRIVKTHLVAVGLNSDRLTAHSLRHTTATLNLLNGGSLTETQQLLRHANLNTTLIYSHALDRANNLSEDRIANAILG